MSWDRIDALAAMAYEEGLPDGATLGAAGVTVAEMQTVLDLVRLDADTSGRIVVDKARALADQLEALLEARPDLGR